MPVGTGPISIPLDDLRDILANLTEFQTWTSTANAAAALARIVRVAGDRPTRPFAWIDFGDGWRYQREVMDSEFGTTGTLLLGFEADRTESEAMEDQIIGFTNSVGGIIAALSLVKVEPGNSASGNRFLITSFEAISKPQRESRDEKDQSDTAEPFIQQRFTVTYKGIGYS